MTRRVRIKRFFAEWREDCIDVEVPEHLDHTDEAVAEWGQENYDAIFQEATDNQHIENSGNVEAIAAIADGPRVEWVDESPEPVRGVDDDYKFEVYDTDSSPTGGPSTFEIGRRLVKGADLDGFFYTELANERFGGVTPATLESALDSVQQAPDDIVDVWLGAGEKGRRAALTLTQLVVLCGAGTELRDLLDR